MADLRKKASMSQVMDDIKPYSTKHFMWGAMPLSAPGSNQQVSTDNSRDCLGKVLRYIAG